MQKLWHSPVRGPLASLMVVVYCAIFLVVPVVALAQIGEGGVDECYQGKADGERDGTGNPAWVLAGLGCGIFGLGAAYLIKPSPDAGALLGKSSEYVMCYTDAYQEKAKGKNAMYAGIGCLVGAVISLAVSGGTAE